MGKYKPKVRVAMDIIPEEMECSSWTEVYNRIKNDKIKNHFLKEDIIYFNCRFGNSGSITIYEMPIQKLESYCWREACGEKAPQKEVKQLELFNDNDIPF